LDALTVNDEKTLQTKVEDLANKSKDNEYLINTRLSEKNKEIQDMKIRYEEMNSTLQSILIILANTDGSGKQGIARQLIEKAIYKDTNFNSG
jgi:hypothetical protein